MENDKYVFDKLDFYGYVNYPMETNKVWQVFSKYEDKCESTADFISDFMNVIPDEDCTGFVFGIYLCERPNFKFKNLNKHPITLRMYGDYMSSKELCDFLFDKCGTSGWEVLHTEMGSFKLIHGDLKFVYFLYVEER